MSNKSHTSEKVQLNEFLQKKKQPIPIYHTESKGSEHNKDFKSIVVVNGKQIESDWKKSKKESEKDCAKNILEFIETLDGYPIYFTPYSKDPPQYNKKIYDEKLQAVYASVSSGIEGLNNNSFFTKIENNNNNNNLDHNHSNDSHTSTDNNDNNSNSNNDNNNQINTDLTIENVNILQSKTITNQGTLNNDNDNDNDNNNSMQQPQPQPQQQQQCFDKDKPNLKKKKKIPFSYNTDLIEHIDLFKRQDFPQNYPSRTTYTDTRHTQQLQKEVFLLTEKIGLMELFYKKQIRVILKSHHNLETELSALKSFVEDCSVTPIEGLELYSIPVPLNPNAKPSADTTPVLSKTEAENNIIQPTESPTKPPADCLIKKKIPNVNMKATNKTTTTTSNSSTATNTTNNQHPITLKPMVSKINQQIPEFIFPLPKPIIKRNPGNGNLEKKIEKKNSKPNTIVYGVDTQPQSKTKITSPTTPTTTSTTSTTSTTITATTATTATATPPPTTTNTPPTTAATTIPIDLNEIQIPIRSHQDLTINQSMISTAMMIASAAQRNPKLTMKLKRKLEESPTLMSKLQKIQFEKEEEILRSKDSHSPIMSPQSPTQPKTLELLSPTKKSTQKSPPPTNPSPIVTRSKASSNLLPIQNLISKK
ncbi:hypothetical protein ACTFIY_011615 [Dictyostelium cf. discoideum]